MEALLKLELSPYQRAILESIQKKEYETNYLVDEEIAFREMFVMLDESIKDEKTEPEGEPNIPEVNTDQAEK